MLNVLMDLTMLLVFIGILSGVFNWVEPVKNNGHYGYLDLYKDILKNQKIRSFTKILIIIIVFYPYTVIAVVNFVVSFKIFPYIIYKDRTFL